MYESPVNLICRDHKIQMTQMPEGVDKLILEAMQEVGVIVDKDELIKAINYDRQQYEKGYTDGKKEVLSKIRERIELEKLGYSPSAGYYKAITKCLQIIDKYMEASE